jgi:membrane-bound lytic murein transglycosylase D
MKSTMRTSLVVLALLNASGQLWAQTVQGAFQNPSVSDPFSGLHDELNSAADSLLAATAQRPMETVLRGGSSNQRAETVDAQNGATRTGSQGRAWQRVEQLRPLIEPILREEGVPTELAAVVLIESGGQPTALSPKGARGIWQFMPDTARRYGLVVSLGTDERLDVQKSTRAAARYLRDLYQRFGSWPLALAAYNAGEDAVDAASGRAGSADFTRISSWLPLETRNYVPAVLGAMGQLSDLRPRQLFARSTAHVLYAAATFY